MKSGTRYTKKQVLFCKFKKLNRISSLAFFSRDWDFDNVGIVKLSSLKKEKFEILGKGMR